MTGKINLKNMLRILYDDFDQKLKNIHDEMNKHHSIYKKACTLNTLVLYFVYRPTKHTTAFQRPYNVHNVKTTSYVVSKQRLMRTGMSTPKASVIHRTEPFSSSWYPLYFELNLLSQTNVSILLCASLRASIYLLIV